MQKFIICVTGQNFDIISDKRLECFILAKDLPAHFKSEFVQKAKALGKIVLGTSPEECTQYDLDGIIIDLSKSENIRLDYQNATKDLKNKFIGVISRNRRHEAMLCSECEPDFIIFRAWADGIKNVEELISWYAEFFVLQVAVMPMDTIDFSSFQSDFVILDDSAFGSI